MHPSPLRQHPSPLQTLPGAFVRALCLCAVGLVCASGARAQVVSQGRGVLTLMLGQGSGPVGAIAADVANGAFQPAITQHSVGWRVSGGYNFADFFSFEAAIGRIGYVKSHAPYQPTPTYTDQVRASTALNIVEANLIGRLPLTRYTRFDVTLGGAETSLNSSFSTQAGSALPAGQANPVHVRRFGYDAGVDAEWMLSDHTSVLVGYHAYPDVGSKSSIGSAHGTFSLLAAGVHIEF